MASSKYHKVSGLIGVPKGPKAASRKVKDVSFVCELFTQHFDPKRGKKTQDAFYVNPAFVFLFTLTREIYTARVLRFIARFASENHQNIAGFPG